MAIEDFSLDLKKVSDNIYNTTTLFSIVNSFFVPAFVLGNLIVKALVFHIGSMGFKSYLGQKKLSLKMNLRLDYIINELKELIE